MKPERKLLRVGIVGCGRVANQHVFAIQASGQAQVVGVADVNQENAMRLATLAGIDKAYSSLEDLLCSTPLDVVHIVTPPAYHYANAKTILDHGVSAFLEKPLVFSAAELRDLYQRAAARQVSLCPDFTWLFHPHLQQGIAMVESGKLGRVKHVECHVYLDPADLHGSDVTESSGLHWSYRLPGGPLNNYLSHPLSIALFFAGVPEDMKVNGSSSGTLTGGLFDQLAIQIQGSRCSASIGFSLAIQPGCTDVRVYCDKGTFTVNYDSQTLLVERPRALPRAVNRGLASFATSYQLTKQATTNIVKVALRRMVPYAGLRLLTSRFYESLQTSSAPPITSELAESVVQAEETIFQHTGKFQLDVNRRPSRQTALLQSERILVTGAGGYVGYHVVKELVAAGYYVRALVRPLSRIERLELLGVEIVFGDVRSADDLRQAAEGMDVIVHAAAAMRGREQFMVDVAVRGTKNVADTAKALNIKRVLYLSSMSVYDYSRMKNGETITETSPLEEQPHLRGSYSLAKREAEDVALLHLKDSAPAWTIVRPAVIIGGGSDPAAAVGSKFGNRLICCSPRGKRVRVIHVDDVATAMISLLQNDSTKNQIYTLSNPAIRLDDYVDTCVANNSPAPSVIYVPYFVTWLGAKSVNLLCKLTGKKPKMSDRQLKYLYRDVGANSDSLTRQTGWQPRHQMPKAVRSDLRPVQSTQ
jgi:predicted dehydrogenase/nucleoside-diphosphate-sugar epimerase